MKHDNSKTSPLGQDDFREIRMQNKYYIDKTLLIKDFIDYENKVALVTRPRRFGKTLNMTMLRDFFDITQDSKDIFAGLKIMETVYADRINCAPVVFLSLKNCTGKSTSDIEQAIAEELRYEYEKYEPLFSGVDSETIGLFTLF